MIIGQIVSLFGAGILKFALSLYVLDITGRAEIFATILAVSTLPVIFLSPIGGAIADRFPKQKLMVIFDFGSSATALLLAFVFWEGNSSIPFIAVIMTILSVISTMYQPAVQSAIPSMVGQEKLMEANGIVSGVASLTAIVAPILGGLMYSNFSINSIVIVSCISFFISAVMEIFIYIPFVKTEKSENTIKMITADIKQGLMYIVKENHFVLKAIVLACGLNLFLTPTFMVGVPYLVKITIGAGDRIFGLVQGTISVSTILAGLGIGVIGQRLTLQNTHRWIFVLALFFVPLAVSVFPGVIATGKILPVALLTVSFMVILFITTVVSIFIMTMVQKETPNELLGKVMSVMFAGSTAAIPIGQVIYGVLLDALSSRVYIMAFVAAGATIIMSVITYYLIGKSKSEHC